jgi:hypothetical protein
MGERRYIYNFLMSVLDEDEWSASPYGRFKSRERIPLIFLIGVWMGPRIGMNALERRKRLTPTGNRSPISHSSVPECSSRR